MAHTALTRPAGTAWMAVLGGWVATIGATALVAPAVAGVLARVTVGADDIAPAVPVVIGIFTSYLVGGYVAGRMAGYRTSWHGLMTAFLGLFVLLVVALLGYAADRGVFAGFGVNSLADLVPGLGVPNVDGIGSALTFGALTGFLAAIFAGWLGGVLAPSRTPVSDRTVRRHEAVGGRRSLLPSFGKEGGDRASPERDEVGRS